MAAPPQVTFTPYPSVAEHDIRRPSYPDDMSTTSSGSSISEQDQSKADPTLQRPRLGSRKSSGTIIIPRDSPNIELKEEEYDDGDARTMSPRRSSEEIEKMGQDARQALIEWVPSYLQILLQDCRPSRRSAQTTSLLPGIVSASNQSMNYPLTNIPRQAKQLQASLMQIVDRVEVVKNEHEKLEGGNRFLQS
jgi:hypothetical protein